jgi:hypothetical protein
MSETIKKGTTSNILYLHLRSSIDGSSKTGLVYNSTGAVASYVRAGAARTAITLATQTPSGAYSSGGFVEVDGTNAKGLYRLDVPNAAFVTGVDRVIIHIGFTGVREESLQIQLVDNTAKDIYDTIVWPAGAVATDGGNSATSFKTNLTEAVNDYWKDAFIRFTSGSLVEQVKKISAYNGTTKFVTVLSGFTAIPSASDAFDIINK